MISGIQSVPIISYPTIMRIQSYRGKISYPVKPLGSVSAVFKHIYTIPSKKGIGGVALYKLSILDGLIERLIKTGHYDKAKALKTQLVDKNNVDTLIKNLSEMVSNYNSGIYDLGIKLETGAVINILA